MKINLYKKFLGVALGVGLTGAAVGALAQTSTQQNNTPAPPAQSEKQTTGDSQSCPMMSGGPQMDMSKMDMSKKDMPKMDMSKMMDCCKKMGMMKSDGPAADKKDNPKQ